MKADDLILFADVVDLGSFTQAAVKHGITASVVSKRIATLEDQLSIQLFYRTTRKLTITEAGRELFDGACQVRRFSQQTYESVAGFCQRLTGHIRVSAPEVSGAAILADVISEFCHQHPGLTVDLSLDNRFVDLIEEGFDLVIRTGHLADSSLIARHLIDAHWVVCVAPEYLHKEGVPDRPQDLPAYNCLRYTEERQDGGDWPFIDHQQPYWVKVSGNFSSDSLTALRNAAVNGYGIIYVPKLLVFDDLDAHRLVPLFSEQVNKRPGIYAVYPFSRHPPDKVRLLIEHIKQGYEAIQERF